MKPSTPRGLPAPRSNAAVRSRNSRQYTQRLSIQNEGGCRFADPAKAGGARESSFFGTCPWGGCSKILLSFRGYVGLSDRLFLKFERRKQGTNWSVLSPSPDFL